MGNGYYKSNFNNRRKDILVTLWENRTEKLTTQDVAGMCKPDYSYCHRIIAEFEDKGLVAKRQVGRSQILELTQKGSLFARQLSKMYETMDILEDLTDDEYQIKDTDSSE